MTEALPVPPMPRGGEQFGAWWDEAAAQAACDAFPALMRHTEAEWAGRPFHLQPWQRDRIVRPIFGWKRADGSRLIRKVWIEVPRKNGKTELAAGLSILMLLGDAEFGGQVYSMAVDKAQAKIVFEKAGVMVSFSEVLRKNIEVLKTSLFCPELNASFKPLAGGGSGSKHGFSPSGAIGDEVHEWISGEVADVVHKGTAARRQPLEVYITTAGVAGEGYAWEEHELAIAIEKGEVIDPTQLVVIFAAPEDADWKSEDTWRSANPNYGISVKPDYMRGEALKAARSPRAENDFKRFHLNMWTEQATRWLPMDSWKRCTAEPGNPDLWRYLFERMRGKRCYGGLDLSISRDLTALSWVFPPQSGVERWTFLWRFWLPRDTVKDQPLRRRARYEAFEAEGALTLTSGNVVDYAFIEKAVKQDAEAFQVEWLGFDRYNATQLSIDLRDKHGVNVEKFGQGFASMNAPSREFERLVVGELMEHGNHPVAHWMAQNVAIEGPDAAGNIKPTKKGRGDAAPKIDGIVAAIMGVGGSMSAEVAQEFEYTGM
jgi:phage terminase large subunit-like protein